MFFTALLIGFYTFKNLVSENTPEITIKAKNTYKETIRISCDVDYDPFSFRDEHGHVVGFDIELANYVANKMRVNLEISLSSWKDAQDAVESGAADIVTGLDYMPGSRFDLTLPTCESGFVAFGRMPYSRTGDLYGKRLSTIGNDASFYDYFCKIKLGENMTVYSSYVDAFKSVVDGQNDYVIIREPVGRRIAKQLGHEEVKPMGPKLLTVSSCWGVKKGSAALLKRLNIALSEAIEDGTLKHLTNKWFGSYVQLLTVHDIFFAFGGRVLILLLCVVFVMFVVSVIQWVRYKREKETEHERGDTMQMLAELDLATKVFNKSSFENKVAEALAKGVMDSKYAFLMIDADYFKNINDSYGHAKGDEALVYIADTLKKLFRTEDIAGRLGGDEFAVLMKQVSNDEAILSKAHTVERTIMDFCLSGEQRLSVSIGISRAPDDGSTFAELYAAADSALYNAKDKGSGFVVLYSPGMKGSIVLTKRDAPETGRMHNGAEQKKG